VVNHLKKANKIVKTENSFQNNLSYKRKLYCLSNMGDDEIKEKILQLEKNFWKIYALQTANKNICYVTEAIKCAHKLGVTNIIYWT
jgi:hypothetical protein